jgi:hypothetical protein
LIKFTIDIKSFERQLEQKKKQILLGVNDGFQKLAPILEGRMKFYMQDIVYNAYISGSKNPDKYDRTYDLLNSIRSEVTNNALYIWSGENINYAERVLKGNKEIPYDFPWVPLGSEGDFRQARNWIEPTRMEILNHFQQGGQLTGVIVKAIQRRI